MKLSANFIKSLVESNKPIDIVGSQLLNIWLEAARTASNTGDFYYKGEGEARAFEDFVLKTCTEQYNLLARECINGSVFQKYPDATFIVMDGMSLREGVLVYNMLKSKGYEAFLEYGFSAIPSDTIAFREKMKVPMSNFKEINNPKNIRLSGNEKYLWSRFPDVMLDKIQVGHTVISSLEEMYGIAAKIVGEVTGKLNATEIIILSDHGYIRSESGFVFTASTKATTKLQHVFGSARYISMNDADASDLVEDGYVEEFGGYYLVKSRYVWPVSGKYSIYLHGGLSLMECLTPVIKVHRRL